MSAVSRSSCLALLLCAAATGLLTAPGTALAQGGPPLVTDDPDTPGDGKWEINLAALGSKTRAGHWEVSAPDADINYGWGEHIQLKADIPWTFVREAGEKWKSGLGTSNVGVKWRFIDEEAHGFAMSTYPQYLSSWSSSSKSRGISSPDNEFFLPVEVSTKAGEFDFAAEAGRNFVRHGDNEWVVGGVVAHGCGEGRECLLEVHETHAAHDSHTLVNLGLHWKLNENLVLLASAGHEFAPRGDEQQGFLFYLGFQVLR